MPFRFNRPILAGALVTALVFAQGFASEAPAPISLAASAAADSPSFRTLAQITDTLTRQERVCGNVSLDVVVCAATRPELGIVLVADNSGFELLELGRQPGAFATGQRLHLEGHLLLRRTDLGTLLSPVPAVDNDDLHSWRLVNGTVHLPAGRLPIEVDWFNCLRSLGLDASLADEFGQFTSLGPAQLGHAAAGATNPAAILPGVNFEVYEGYWEKIPDFALLTPVKSGVVSNFDMGVRTRDEMVALKFTGLLDIPKAGDYTFRLGSDDGSLLFIGSPELSLQRSGSTNAPLPERGLVGQSLERVAQRRWLKVEGRVSFVSSSVGGAQLEIRSGADTLSVNIVDSTGLDLSRLLHAFVQVEGLGRAALSCSQRIVLDRLIVPDARGLRLLKSASEVFAGPDPLVSISQVQSMRLGLAKRELPVRIRGVVTAANRTDRWVSLQDETRGVFVTFSTLSNNAPACGEWWEVTGHTGPGNFAPVVVAQSMRRLGIGRLPEPARPSWNELANGSMDVQWVEFQGLVSGVQSNRFSLLLPEGHLDVLMERFSEEQLRPCLGAVVRLRGALFATWNTDTREVQFGTVKLRHASLSVETPAPSAPFELPTKTVRDLLRFDVQSSALRPAKVRAQVLYADGPSVFAQDENMGLRVLTTEVAKAAPGDIIEAVGYPELGGGAPLLRQARIRKVGVRTLPWPRVLGGAELLPAGMDSTAVQLEGNLIGVHWERGAAILELQSSGRLFFARVKPGTSTSLTLRAGSKLQLSGVYAETGRNVHTGMPPSSFELLLNSPADIVVLSQPSWWTFRRLMFVVALLIIVLTLAAFWIGQLRRQVEYRTEQLQFEIRERERAEHHHALEAERSRIARDLHDDLGSTLTEINALASTGQRAAADGGSSPAIYDAIAGRARGSIAALDVIVWAVDPEDNSVQSLADYLSGFVGDYLANSRIACRFKIPMTFSATTCEGRVRHELFLAVKEALNNVVRHSEATEVEFAMTSEAGAIEIRISDNGRGFELPQPQRGDGLRNLPQRLAKLGGTCRIDSRIGAGTVVTIRLPLSAGNGAPVPSALPDTPTFSSAK